MSGRNLLRAVFFGVNTLGALVFLAAGVASVVAPFMGAGSPYAFIGGIAFSPLAATGIVFECIAFLRKKRALERNLGIVCLILAAFAVFAAVSNVAEVYSEGGKWDANLTWVVSIALAVAAWFASCGLIRLRLNERVTSSRAANVE
jgi:hypothetical protein